MLSIIIISTSGGSCLSADIMTGNRGKLMDLLEDRFFNPDKLHAQETYNYRMEGEEEGMTKKAAEIAGKMIEDDVPTEKISEYTGLSEEEILKLKEELS